MHFFRIVAFAILLLFSYNICAQTNRSALQVSNEVTFTGGASGQTASTGDGSSWVGDHAGGLAVAGGVAVAAGLLALTGVGLIGALALGAIAGGYAYKAMKPDVCSFDRIMSSFQSLAGGSWLSPVFNMIFNAINQLATAVNNQLGGTVIKILALMMAFYILYVAIKYIVSFSPIEPVKFLTELFFPLGRCIIAVIMIKYWADFFENVLSPVLNLAINFGVKVMESMGNSTTSYTLNAENGFEIVRGTCTQTAAGAGLNIDVCNSIQTFLGTISSSLVVWMAFGATLLSDCWGNGFMGLPSFKMFFIGLIFFVFTFMVYLSFPLKLLDALFRLMFVMVLFPVWCMFWVIPKTRDYCKKAIDMVIHVMATFLSASIILIMVITILSNLFEGIPLKKVIELLQDDKAEEAMKLVGFSTTGLFYSVCLLFMSFHLVSKVDYFANLFGKQESLGMGAKMGAAVTTVVQSTPQAVRMGGNAMKWGTAKGIDAMKWGAGKVKSGWNTHKAKSYNADVPGGTARKSPRLWTAAIPGIGLWDAHKAKAQIGEYARTKDVSVSGVEKMNDGSKQQTYSNRTVDKFGKTLAQMKETTSTSADESKQSVDRNVTRFDEAGGVRKNANVKKDFENGKAVRKTTTTTNKDGSRTETMVDRSGNVTKTRFAANGQRMSSEKMQVTFDPSTRKMKFSERTVENYGADGSVISRSRIGRDGKPIPTPPPPNP